MQLSVRENTSVEILLGCGAQVLIFCQDLLVESVDILELFVGGLVVSVDFVFHLTLQGGQRNASHDVEEHRAAKMLVSAKVFM